MLKKYLVHPFTIFSVASVVFFWPISLFLFSLKNDALTYYYPVRTLISDALRNAELPLWTPFINMGYPLHADMQSGAWNPVVWIFSFLSNYSLAAFHYELLFYFTVAGIGFYYLCRNLGCSKATAYTMAFAFQFSGFMIDSVQFFTCISAACYLPWIILFFRRMIMQYRIADALGLSFLLYLLITGGYPSFFIITIYVLVAYGLFVFFSSNNKLLFLKKITIPLFIACIFFIALSLPALISFADHLPMIDRGKQQLLPFVLENSMNPANTLSLLSPFATTATDRWNDSNILMRNIYIGIIPLLFLILAFFNGTIKKNKELLFFFFLAIVMMGMAWGKFFYFRQAAYYFFPLMDRFRHPALFRLFSIFFLLLIAAASLKEWESRKELKEQLFRKITILLLGSLLIAGIFSIIFLNNKIPAGDLTISNLKSLLMQFNFQQRFLIQLPFFMVTLLLGYVFIVKRKNIRLICLLTIADLFFATQLNIPVTVIGSKKFTEVEHLINRNPTRFPIPGHESIEQNAGNSSGENIITGSTLPFSKKAGRNDYYITPGNLSLQDKFYESSIREAVFKNPVLYFHDTLNESRKNDKITIHAFSANHMKATVETSKGDTLIYLQNNYPGWRVFTDGKEKEISSMNISFMGVFVPGGIHEIEFRYRPAKVITAWYISSVSFILLLLWIGYLLFAAKRSVKRQKENE